MMPTQLQDADIVVVGTGPSASAACLALSQQSLSVTILESGTSMPGGLALRANGRNLLRFGRDVGNQMPFTAPLNSKSMWVHELGFGGLSNHWTGAVPRYTAADFTDGERLNEKYRWPIGYDDVAPFYAKIEQLLGVSASNVG